MWNVSPIVSNNSIERNADRTLGADCRWHDDPRAAQRHRPAILRIRLPNASCRAAWLPSVGARRPYESSTSGESRTHSASASPRSAHQEMFRQSTPHFRLKLPKLSTIFELQSVRITASLAQDSRDSNGDSRPIKGTAREPVSLPETRTLRCRSGRNRWRGSEPLGRPNRAS